MFLSREGKIVRYLQGLKLKPADMELAVIDAKAGRERSFIQNVQQLCYSYDPQAQGYTFRIDTIILSVVGLVAVVLTIYLLRQGRRRKQASVECQVPSAK